VVGFDATGDTPYYIVKNSWGTDWGEDGFVKIAITGGVGVCGISSEPSFPSLLLALSKSEYWIALTVMAFVTFVLLPLFYYTFEKTKEEVEVLTPSQIGLRKIIGFEIILFVLTDFFFIIS